jgi:hypothetical protein
MSTRSLHFRAALAVGLLALAPSIALSAPLSSAAAQLHISSLTLFDPGPDAGAGTDERIELAQAERRQRRRSRSRRSNASNAGSGAAAAQGGIPGRYAVLRDKNKDAGCLLSLNRSGRALVGPGCADQGIQIFDPVRWSYSGGQIILRARKGHRISFGRKADGTWQRTPAAKTALGLKKY